MALVDSGADFCVFHANIGEAIGIDVRSGVPHNFGGVASRENVSFLHEVELALEDFTTIDTRVAFSYELTDPYKGFLGQRGFFDHFKITFRYSNHSFSLSI